MMVVAGRNYKLESSEMLIPNVVVTSKNRIYNVSIWVIDIGHFYARNEQGYLGLRCRIEKTFTGLFTGFKINVYKTTNRGK